MKIAFILSQMASPQQMSLAAALRLRDAGHEVHVFVPQSGQELMSHSGLPHTLIPDPAITAFNALLEKPKSRRSFASRRMRAQKAIQKFGVDDLREGLSNVDPDLVLVDTELSAHAIVSVGAGYRTALLASMFQSPPGLSAPPLHFRQSPGAGPRGSRPAIAMAWAYYMARKFALLLRNALRDWGADHPSALSVLERREGTRIGRHLWVWQMPFNLRLPMLLMVPGPLDLPVRPRTDQRFIGPLVLKDRPSRPFDTSVLDRFSSGRKRILVAFGTMLRTKDALLKAIIEAAKSNPDWEVLGLVRAAQPVPDLPENVTLVPWGPQRALLEHADVAVIHAGVASVIECIEAEVPMLLYPQVNDQQGNAARVAFHGLGLIGDHGDTALTLARQITELSRDKDVARRLAEMHRRFDAAADDKALERAVATLANTGRLS